MWITRVLCGGFDVHCLLVWQPHPGRYERDLDRKGKCRTISSASIGRWNPSGTATS
jgi:hypothetical protein